MDFQTILDQMDEIAFISDLDTDEILFLNSAGQLRFGVPSPGPNATSICAAWGRTAISARRISRHAAKSSGIHGCESIRTSAMCSCATVSSCTKAGHAALGS